jgi:hypothetical protein
MEHDPNTMMALIRLAYYTAVRETALGAHPRSGRHKAEQLMSVPIEPEEPPGS